MEEKKLEIIFRLLENGSISGEEAKILMKKSFERVYVISYDSLNSSGIQAQLPNTGDQGINP